MSHRALQIVDAVKAVLEADSSLAAAVYRHRTASLSEADAELPAVSVGLGDDEPIEPGNLAYIDSLLTMTVTAAAIASSEEALVEELVRLRSEVHQVLMADRQQGLAFVIDTRYGGASAPEVNADGGRYAGTLESRWLVHYRMNVSSPE